MRWSRRRAAGRARTPRPSSILAGIASRDIISRRTKRTVAYGTTVSGEMTEYKIGTNFRFSGNLRVDEDIRYGYSELEEGSIVKAPCPGPSAWRAQSSVRHLMEQVFLTKGTSSKELAK
jgi:hypothetical protein